MRSNFFVVKMLDIPEDFKEFLSFAISRNVRFLIVGGYAYGYYAQPRNTGDIDILIEQSLPNAEAVLAALSDFGFTSLNIQVNELMVPNQVIQLGYSPLRIDILTSIDGVEFQAAYLRRKIISRSGLEIPLISLDDLITNKRATKRPIDLSDLEQLIKVASKESKEED